MPDAQSLPDQGAGQPDLMAALEESLDRPTWVIHLNKHAGVGRSRSATWVGVAEDRDAANAAALEWVRDPGYYVSYADGPFVPLRERDRLRAENEALKAALENISHLFAPLGRVADARRIANTALASDEQRPADQCEDCDRVQQCLHKPCPRLASRGSYPTPEEGR